MSDFKSGKPKPSWAQASKQVGDMTPREIHTRQSVSAGELSERSQRSRQTIDPSPDDEFNNTKALQTLYRYAEDKDRKVRGGAPDSDAIVNLPRSEQKKTSRNYDKNIKRK